MTNFNRISWNVKKTRAEQENGKKRRRRTQKFVNRSRKTLRIPSREPAIKVPAPIALPFWWLCAAGHTSSRSCCLLFDVEVDHTPVLRDRIHFSGDGGQFRRKGRSQSIAWVPPPSNASLYLIRKSPGLIKISSVRTHLLQESSLEFHCLAALHLTFGQNPRIHWNILPSQKAGTVAIGEMYAIEREKWNGSSYAVVVARRPGCTESSAWVS